MYFEPNERILKLAEQYAIPAEIVLDICCQFSLQEIINDSQDIHMVLLQIK